MDRVSSSDPALQYFLPSYMTQHRKPIRIVLSIAGYDPSSGAGITADIKTIAAHACYGVTCITALTVQSTQGVARVVPVQGRVISETLECLAQDLKIAAVKIGMLGSAAAAAAVAGFLERHAPRFVVVDPILRSSSGAELISREAFQILRSAILPQAYVITPNIEEAAALSGVPVANPEDMEAAARRLQKMGAQNVIITAGHLDRPHDLLCRANRKAGLLKGKRISSRSTHGTGCAFSTSLACELALGRDLPAAATAAKWFVEAALKRAPMIGKGVGPVV
jgi:hydroxymethylpyrimidine/phosphomethylpyrimidine kinase